MAVGAEKLSNVDHGLAKEALGHPSTRCFVPHKITLVMQEALPWERATYKSRLSQK